MASSRLTTAAIEVRGVSVRLGDHLAVAGVSFTMLPGQRMSIVGPSGSGKTTLLRVLTGFDRATAGEIRVDGRLVSGPRSHVPPHQRGLGYVTQHGALFPHLTVAQNIAFALPRGDGREPRVHRAAVLAGIPNRLFPRYPRELSGGQQQRVALARALAPEPKMIVLDEPLSSLDSALRLRMRQTISESLVRSGTTALMVTHDREEALGFGDLVGVMRDGELLQWGVPETVFGQPNSLAVATSLGDAVLLPVHEVGAGGDSATTTLGRVPLMRAGSSGVAPDRVGAAATPVSESDAVPGTGADLDHLGPRHTPQVVMVRPSQLRIHLLANDSVGGGSGPVPRHREGNSHPTAQVIRTDFAGEMTRVHVRAANDVIMHIAVPSSEAKNLVLGAGVRIEVVGAGILYRRE